MPLANISVQATPVSAYRDFLSQVSGAPDRERWASSHEP